MFGYTWNHKTIRKYVILFGTLFNNIYITRQNKAGETIQTLKIPLNYGPKEKFLARLEGNPNLDREIAISLPRISFELTDINYAAERKLATIGKITAQDPNNPSQKLYQYNPVPYDFNFTLSIMVKNAEDGTAILEQILPYFNPAWTASVNLNPDLGVPTDVPIILNSVVSEDTYEGDFINRRALIWTLQFTVKGYVFGPTKTSGVIKEVDVNVYIPEVDVAVANPTNSTPAFEMIVKPGLTTNGEPTANAALSIDASLINSTDNYGFIFEFIENV